MKLKSIRFVQSIKFCDDVTEHMSVHDTNCEIVLDGFFVHARLKGTSTWTLVPSSNIRTAYYIDQ